jgi:alcohol dehydrogenase
MLLASRRSRSVATLRRGCTGRQGLPITLPESLLALSPVRVLFADGAMARIGGLARSEGATACALISDRAVAAAGHVETAQDSLARAGVSTFDFLEADANPTTETVNLALAHARAWEAAQRRTLDFVVAVGGGSAMDCAKGLNLLLTNGGAIPDYWGVNKAREPLLASILAPTTAGTGSEAQSFALISDAKTHAKMACGDRRPPTAGGLRPRWAILDPALTRTQPPAVAAATAMDALTHAIESAGCKARTDDSRRFSAEAWRRLSRNAARAVANPRDAAARAEMLIGAHLAGCAIELSMLGAAHACANPLTARFDVVHGVAVGVMMPHVIRFNAAAGNPYSDLHASAEELAVFVEGLRMALGLPTSLKELGVPPDAIPELATAAAGQWTAGYNPRPVSADDCRSLYEAAMG